MLLSTQLFAVGYKVCEDPILTALCKMQKVTEEDEFGSDVTVQQLVAPDYISGMKYSCLWWKCEETREAARAVAQAHLEEKAPSSTVLGLIKLGNGVDEMTAQQEAYIEEGQRLEGTITDGVEEHTQLADHAASNLGISPGHKAQIDAKNQDDPLYLARHTGIIPQYKKETNADMAQMRATIKTDRAVQENIAGKKKKVDDKIAAAKFKQRLDKLYDRLLKQFVAKNQKQFKKKNPTKDEIKAFLEKHPGKKAELERSLVGFEDVQKKLDKLESNSNTGRELMQTLRQRMGDFNNAYAVKAGSIAHKNLISDLAGRTNDTLLGNYVSNKALELACLVRAQKKMCDVLVGEGAINNLNEDKKKIISEMIKSSSDGAQTEVK